MPSIPTHTFTHPLLGPLTGRVEEVTPRVTHFRSIPFATIPARFRQAVLLEGNGKGGVYTEYGTACYNPDFGIGRASLSAPFGGLLPGEEERKFSEFECLNLTISAPTSALGTNGLGKGKGLPVMVYVHGGAFKVGGGHVSDVHKTTRLVEQSIEEGMPVVIVSIHYRLNWFGFLACQDLIDEAQALNEPPSNFGLYDQRTAFHWIHANISGFGGNPTDITAFGESAGSGSLALHMSTSVPLFKRAILQSGTTATGPPIELKYKEAEYRALLEYCGIDTNDPERLRKLRDVSVEKLVAAANGVGISLFHSLQDEQFFTRGFPNWWSENELISNCPWVDEIIIGDTFFEGWIFAETFRPIALAPFIALTTRILGPPLAAKVLSAYNITPTTDANLFWTQLLLLYGDLIFSAPTHKLARGLAGHGGGKKIWRYTFTVRNPLPGSNFFQVPGHHFVDLVFLFQTLESRLPTEGAVRLGRELGRRWLGFANGRGAWDDFELGEETKEEKVLIISGDGKWEVKGRERDERESRLTEEGKRRYEGWEVLEEVYEALVLERGQRGAEDAIWEWTCGGPQRLLGVGGPYGVVI